MKYYFDERPSNNYGFIRCSEGLNGLYLQKVRNGIHLQSALNLENNEIAAIQQVLYKVRFKRLGAFWLRRNESQLELIIQLDGNETCYVRITF